jgi:hypothetical protein
LLFASLLLRLRRTKAKKRREEKRREEKRREEKRREEKSCAESLGASLVPSAHEIRRREESGAVRTILLCPSARDVCYRF